MSHLVGNDSGGNVFCVQMDGICPFPIKGRGLRGHPSDLSIGLGEFPLTVVQLNMNSKLRQMHIQGGLHFQEKAVEELIQVHTRCGTSFAEKHLMQTAAEGAGLDLLGKLYKLAGATVMN